jgi:hydrogenase maturation factor
MGTTTSPSGKISANTFKDLVFNSCGYHRNEVLVGPQFGVDTAIIDIGNSNVLAVSSDPLTLIPSLGLKESAWLSVHLLANDMATTGFAPQFAQFVLNLPVTFSEKDFQQYWHYIHHFCKELGIAITGGHTGRVPGQESTICGGGTMFLKASKDKVLSSNKAQPGDVLVVTKESALSATAILAKSFPETVKKQLGEAVYKEAESNFYRTSSLKEALLAAAFLQPHQRLKAMHDVTEGGILGAVCEMARASSCGVLINNEKIPVGIAQQEIAAFFEIDHRTSIGAGAMLMAVATEAVAPLLSHLEKHTIKATQIGVFTQEESGFMIEEEGVLKPLNYDGIDPYWEAFYKAYKEGLQ